MNSTTKEAVLAVLVCLFFATFVACALTGVTMLRDHKECVEQGGTYSIDGGTAWCRY